LAASALSIERGEEDATGRRWGTVLFRYRTYEEGKMKLETAITRRGGQSKNGREMKTCYLISTREMLKAEKGQLDRSGV